MTKSIMITVAASCLVVGVLLHAHLMMKERQFALLAMLDAERRRVRIPHGSRFAKVSVGTRSADVWYIDIGGGRIVIDGTVPSRKEIAELKQTVAEAKLSFPVSWDLQLQGQPPRDALEGAAWAQLAGTVFPRLVRFWGLSPLLFPSIMIALFAFVRTSAARRILDGSLLAWGLWILSSGWFDSALRDHRTFQPLWFVLVAGVAWGLVAKARAMNRQQVALRLLLPCAVPVLADALYAPVNAGILVSRFGCGCIPEFNTNNITLWFFAAVWCVALIVTAVVSRQHGLKTRLIHLALTGGLTFWLSREAMCRNLWM